MDWRKVCCHWTEWRERYKDCNTELPDGWKKSLVGEYDRDRYNLAAPESHGKYVYRFKGSHQTTYWYPLSLRNLIGAQRIDSNVPYLRGEVQMAYAYTFGNVSTLEDKYGLYGCKHPYIPLSNSDRKWIGLLRLYNTDDFEERGICSDNESHEVQLIAISEGFIPK
jgi:hypothetical protein